MNRGRRRIEFIEDRKQRISTFSKRKDGLINKVRELSVLCGVKACMIINGPKGVTNQELDCVWSSDSDATLRDLIKRYKEESVEESGRRKRVSNVKDYYIDRKRKVENELANLRKKNLESRFPVWHPNLDLLKEDELRNLGAFLEVKLKSVKARRDLIKNARTNKVIGSSNSSYGSSSSSNVHDQQFLDTNAYSKMMRMSMNSFENNSNYNPQPIAMMEPSVMNPITSFENNSNYNSQDRVPMAMNSFRNNSNYNPLSVGMMIPNVMNPVSSFGNISNCNSQNRMTVAMNSFENNSNYNPRSVGTMEPNVFNPVSSFGSKSNYNSQSRMAMVMNSSGNNNYYPQNRITMPTNPYDIQPIAMIKPGTNQMVQPMFHSNTTNNMEPQFCYDQMPLPNHSTAQKDANMFSSSSLVNPGKVTNQSRASFYDPNLFDCPELDSSPMQQSYACGSQFDNCFDMQSVYDPSPPYSPLLLEYSSHPEVPSHRQSSQHLDFHNNFQ